MTEEAGQTPANFDADRFSKIASGVQSIVTAGGLLIAGVWVLFTFWDLGLAERSRAEIAEIEQRSIEQPVLSISFEWTTYNEIDQKKPSASLSASFKNDGKRALEFRDLIVNVFRINENSGDPDPKPKFSVVAKVFDFDSHLLTVMPPRILRSGQARSVAFPIPPIDPGDWLIQLQTVYSGLILKDGQFEPSGDVAIQGIEQKVVHVSAGVHGNPSPAAH